MATDAQALGDAAGSNRGFRPGRTIRSIFVLLFLFLGTLLLFSANVGFWVRNDIYDTEGFVETTTAVVEDEDVQAALAEALALRIYNAADVTGLLRDELPERLRFLAVPLGDTLLEFLERAALRLIQGPRLQAAFEEALRVAHTAIIRIIESDAITSTSDEIVIDLRPVLDEIIAEIGLEERLDSTEADESILVRLDLPPDAGQFTIQNQAAAWVFRIARFGDNIILAVGIAALVAFLAGVALAVNRRNVLRNVGILFAVVGLISLALLIPVRIFTSELARHPDAAGAVVRILTEQFRFQSFGLIVAGMLILGVAFALGGSRLARWLRGSLRTSTGERESLGGIIRDYATPLRVFGLAAGAILLLVWPDPSTRVQITILALTAIYLGAIWLIASDSETAANARERAGGLWSQHVGTPAGGGWVADHVGFLRIAGIVVAVALMVFLPSLTFGNVVAVVAITLAYLAGVDLLAGRSGES